MKQPIAGVVPPETSEATVTTVWPSIVMYPIGEWMGRIFSIKWPNVYIFRLGNLIALFSIPLAAGLYFYRVAPKFGTRYRITNRRIIVERGVSGAEERSIGLDEFDEIKIEVKSGQAWFDAADLVFCRDSLEVFRLQGISRPEPFQQTCWKTHRAYCSVASVRRQQEQQPVA